jgi:hypothetical protein
VRRQLDVLRAGLFSPSSPKAFKGVEIDGGEFVTSAGSEVFEARRTGITRARLPYYHFGVRTTIPIGNNEGIATFSTVR